MKSRRLRRLRPCDSCGPKQPLLVLRPRRLEFRIRRGLGDQADVGAAISLGSMSQVAGIASTAYCFATVVIPITMQ